MLLLLLSLMGYHLWSEIIHEWLGVAFLLLILLHNTLNIHWFKRLFQGNYSLFRLINVSLNVLLMITILCAIISGLMLSRHVLPDAAFHSSSDWVRKTHMTSVHWIQVLIALHLGLHWKMLANFFCNILKISEDSLLAKRLLPALFSVIAVYGLYTFIQRELWPYLLMQIDFAFFDYDESRLIFYCDFLAISLFFAYMTRIWVWFFLFRNKQI